MADRTSSDDASDDAHAIAAARLVFLHGRGRDEPRYLGSVAACIREKDEPRRYSYAATSSGPLSEVRNAADVQLGERRREVRKLQVPLISYIDVYIYIYIYILCIYYIYIYTYI